MVYENKHPIIINKSLGPFEIFENQIKNMILNISADKFFNKNLYKFNHHNPQENEESKLFTQNELPGEFGIPHSSIKSKQVCFHYNSND